jgi:hypothetical protein
MCVAHVERRMLTSRSLGVRALAGESVQVDRPDVRRLSRRLSEEATL